MTEYLSTSNSTAKRSARKLGFREVEAQHFGYPESEIGGQKRADIRAHRPDFDGFSDELEGVLACEPDVVMLPYFKTVREVETFIKAVDGRATTSLLLETKEAAEQIDDIISVGGIDEIHIGLNDLSHSYGKKFLFEELADGTVDRLVERFKADGIKNYGFGGIASLGSGLLPAEMIIPEHYRLGSNCAILSRAFCDVSKVGDIDEIRRVFDEGVSAIRDYEKSAPP